VGCGLDDDEFTIEVISVEKVENPTEIDKEIPTVLFKCCNETYALASNLSNYWEIEKRHCEEHPECAIS
jgi:hypothetical protein